MEQKRILWIVAAVGLFLLVVVGFALIVYSPNQRQDPIITSNQSTNDIWASTQNTTPQNTSSYINNLQGTPLENVYQTSVNQPINNQENSIANNANLQNPSINVANPGLQTQNQLAPQYNGLPSNSMVLEGQQKVQDLTVVSENTKVITSAGTTIDLSGISVNSSTQPVVTQNTNSNTSSTKNIVTPAKTTTTKKTSASSPTKNTSVAKTNKTAKTSSTTKATTTSAPVHKYWIQAGSYSSKKNAEEAKYALSEEKIASEIFTYTDSNGKLFYRVRIGPYTTKKEAEYWQSRVALIDKFSSSKTYITDSSAKKQ